MWEEEEDAEEEDVRVRSTGRHMEGSTNTHSLCLALVLPVQAVPVMTASLEVLAKYQHDTALLITSLTVLPHTLVARMEH